MTHAQQIDNHILPKIKNKNRKARHSFPNELDDKYENVVKHKRHNSMPTIVDDDFGSYNEKHTIITKNADGVKKEVVIKKYTKVHPHIQETSNDKDESIIESNPIIDGLSKVIAKVIYYVCMFSCVLI